MSDRKLFTRRLLASTSTLALSVGCWTKIAEFRAWADPKDRQEAASYGAADPILILPAVA